MSDHITCRKTGAVIAYHMGCGRLCLCPEGECKSPDGGGAHQVPKKTIGGAVFTTIRLALPNGQFEDIQVVSADAVLSVLRNPCVRKLETGEPFFVLRGQDSSAADLVEDWAHRNMKTVEHDKITEAVRLSVSMRRWPNRRNPT